MNPTVTTVHFLAHTLTGKSTLTAGMYARFKERPHGFRLYAADAAYKPDDDRDMDLTDAWENIKAGAFPEHTGQLETLNYHFELQHDTVPFIQFDWLDYRGTVISSRSDVPDYAGFRRQIDKIQSNGCLFIGVSAEYLIKPIEGDARLLSEVKSKAWVDRIDQLTKDVKSSTPAVIVITKADLPGFDRRSPKGVVEDLKLLFPDWFKTGTKRIVMVCPVSAVDGRNLECPLIFAAWATLMRQHAAAQQHLGQTSSAYDEKYYPLDYFFSENFGSGQYKRQVDSLYDTRTAARQRVQAVAERLKPFADALVPMIMFRDGREMSDNEKRGIYTFS